MKSILTIAGFDPTSGAGVTRDIDTFCGLGIHGLSAPTCMVIQGPRGVMMVEPTPLRAFKEMLRLMTTEIPFQGIKVGVAWDSAYLLEIVELVKRMKDVPLVVDPVFAAKNGTELISEKGIRVMREQLFPLSSVVTPNIDEASRLCETPIVNLQDMEKCVRMIHKAGPKTVILKGGHLADDPVDIFFDGHESVRWKRKRIDRTIHGTGCSFSSLITSFLVLGYSPRDAFFASEQRMEELLRTSYRIDGAGYYYLSTGIPNGVSADRRQVIRSLEEARDKLIVLNPVELVPEVQMGFAYAIEGARGIEDVAAFPGRIGRHAGRILMKAEASFGASPEAARMILSYMGSYPYQRAVAVIRYQDTFISTAVDHGLSVVQSVAKKKPDSGEDGARGITDPIVDMALRDSPEPPDIIYDKGGAGREAVIRLFAKSPRELIERMEMIRQ